MWARVTSIGLKGMDGYRVSVEVGTYVGNDSFKIVGLRNPCPYGYAGSNTHYCTCSAKK
jgi:hypothetical protein